MPRPIRAIVHPDALAHNLRRVRAAAGEARVWAVVKADAYGHGIERAHAGLRGADGYALLDLAEAERLRGIGWRGPVLLLEGCFSARDLEACSRLDLWHVVHREAQIDWLAAHRTLRAQRVFLKLNSGMNRLGFRGADAFRAAWQRLSGLTQVDEITAMTHFADADAADTDASDADADSPDADASHADAARAHALDVVPSSRVSRQAAQFEAAVADLPGERSLCNSAATLRHAPHDAAVRGDWVRAGIALYGSAPDYPARSIADWQLEPAMTLRSELIATQDLQPGDRVGYGGTFTAPAAMRIGIVACGYADGYPRHAPNGTPVLVDGERTRLVGRVSMDMLAVDLSGLPGAAPGSEVTLWGWASSGARLPVDEVAHPAGTIGYELLCARAPRVPVESAPLPPSIEESN